MTYLRSTGLVFGVVVMLAACGSSAPDNAVAVRATEPAESDLEHLEPEPVLPPVGLYHEARESAAEFAAEVRRLLQLLQSGVDGGDYNPLWFIEDVMIDEFTDQRGQAAWLVGRYLRLALIVGCSNGSFSGIAVGGLRGNTISNPTPMLLFQDGRVDLRWGDGEIVPTVWLDGDEVLVLSGQAASDLLYAAARKNRLRMRTTAIRNTIVNEEFDLRNLDIAGDAIRVRDAQDEMTCALTLN